MKTTKNDKNQYYVYAYLDISKPGTFHNKYCTFTHEPFYIGKGKDDRLKSHLLEAQKFYFSKKRPNKKRLNWHKINKIIKIYTTTNKWPIIEFVKNNISEEEAFIMEIDCIKEIGRRDLNTGTLLNMTNGGDGTSGRKMTKHQIEAMRLRYSIPILQFDITGNFIKEWISISEAAKNFNLTIGYISACLHKKRKTGANNFWFFKKDFNIIPNKLSDSTIQKLTTIDNDYQKKKVIQYSINGELIKIWESINEAANHFKINCSNIVSVCKQKSKTAAGYVWFFNSHFNKNPPLQLDNEFVKHINRINNDYQKKKVVQYTLDGNLVKIWDSMNEAAKALNTKHNLISLSCKETKVKYTCANYVWFFEKDFESINPPLKISFNIFNKNEHTRKKILQFSSDGTFVKEWSSISEAQRICDGKGNIGDCLRNKVKTAKGFIWKYK